MREQAVIAEIDALTEKMTPTAKSTTPDQLNSQGSKTSSANACVTAREIT